MKKINLLISIGIVVLAVFNINWYLNKKPVSHSFVSLSSSRNGAIRGGQNNSAMDFLNLENENKLSESEKNNIVDNEQSEKNEMREKISIKIADGWDERIPPERIVAIIVNVNEEIKEDAAKEIGFSSYYAVNYDVLHGENIEEHIKYEKAGLLNVAPNIDFIEEEKTEINGREAYIMEAEFSDNKLEYKVFIALFRGDNNDVWAVSFNSTKQYGEEYRELAIEVFNSFIVK
ncbi:hypothetical protein ACFL23_02335 [Patescibacteria group bacterium]